MNVSKRLLALPVVLWGLAAVAPSAWAQPAPAPSAQPPAAAPVPSPDAGEDAAPVPDGGEDADPGDEGDEGDEGDGGAEDGADGGEDTGDDGDEGDVMGDGGEEDLESIEAEWGLTDTEDYNPPLVIPDMEKQPEGQTRLKHHYHRWIWRNLFGVRVNPLGLTNRFQTGYRYQLFDRPETIFEDSYIAPMLDTEITPAFGYVGARVEFQPMALLNFWGSYGMMGTFSSFSHTRSFPNARAEYDDDLLGETTDQAYTSLGNRAIIAGRFQVGIAGLYFRSTTTFFYHGLPLENGDKVVWIQLLDVLSPNKGWVATNDADLLFYTDWDLIIGMRHTVTHAFYRADQNPGRNLNTPMHRVGPVLAYQFYDDPIGAPIDKPTVLLLTQWWAQHRYRTRQSPALPYIALAFRMEGDFYTSEKE